MDRLAQFNEVRPSLFALAYRMLGARADAEDVVQESYLRWHNTVPEEIRSPRSYLMTIAARLSLDALKAAHRKRETYTGPWLPEPLIGMPAPNAVELSESLSIAFVHLLEALSPAERVAFLLHEVFDSSYAEIATTLETSEANARQLVSRSRKHIREKRARFRVDRERHQAVVRQFVSACNTGDWDTLMPLLREDVVFYSDAGGERPSALNPIYGREKVMRLLQGIARMPDPDLAAGHFESINGEPGFVFTRGDRITGTASVDLDENGRIRGIFTVLNPLKLHE